MGYSKQETIKKQKKLVSKSQRNKRKILVNIFRVFLVAILAVIIAGAGAGFGMMKGILDHAPDINTITIAPKGFRTIIYDVNGNVEREISTIDSNREYVYFEDIPKDIVNAFVAIEDERFWTHNGIDVKGIMRAFVKGVASKNFDEGASTLTQQLIKNKVFNVGMGENTFLDSVERKVQEQYLALELEKRYTKEQIVEYYLNTIYLGRGTNGIQTAAEQYFGKDMTKLSISEIAVIAGITQNPSKYDPVIYPENNAKRRKDVLDKMKELEYITQEQYNAAIADDVYARITQENERQIANDTVNTFYEDTILKKLNEEFQEIYSCTETEAWNLIYTGGYSVYSVQDKAIQDICDTVINDDSYVEYLEAKVGLDYNLTIIDPDGKTPHNYSRGNMMNYFINTYDLERYTMLFDSEEEARIAADEFKEAMLNETGGTFESEMFDCVPQPQFSFTIMDQKTGFVKAIFGGKGKKTANLSLNRATDSPRQPGSTFKILAAYLPLFDTGEGALATPFKDEPYNYVNGNPVNNWYGGYRGYCTSRDGIRDSMNVLAVKAITKVTPEVAYDYLLKVGLTTLVERDVDSDGGIISDINQSCALGGLTVGVNTYEMTAAYASIANNGVYVKPVVYSKVVDHEGNVIIDNTTPNSKRVMKPSTAFQLIEGMKSVVTGGTGTACRLRTGITCAGKTGTTSSSYDLWFCGMTPYYTASIWMGYDTNITLNTGVVHENIWRDVMDQIAEMEGQDPSLDFERPDDIKTVTLCKISGKYPVSGCPTCSDYADIDFSPGGTCTGHNTIKLCKESKKVATDKCPETIEFTVEENALGQKVLLIGSGISKAEAEGYEYTEEKCDIHKDDKDKDKKDKDKDKDKKDKDKITINVSCGEGGTISAPATVSKGSSVSITITPNSGYRIKDVIVNGASVGAVSQYFVANAQSDISISATFERVSQPETPKPVQPKPEPTTEAPTTEAPTTEAPTTEASTTETPTTEASTTEAPTEAQTEAPTEATTDENQQDVSPIEREKHASKNNYLNGLLAKFARIIEKYDVGKLTTE